MKTTQRHYAEVAGDFHRLSHFMIKHSSYLRSHSTWCLGRFVDWKYGLWGDKLATPGFWEQNAQLWLDGFGELAGFAIAENGDADFAILTMAGYRCLFEEMLQWVLVHWGARPPALAIEITAQQTLEAGGLERYGFQRTASFYTFHYDLPAMALEPPSLEAGFTIVDMQTHPDYRAQRILRYDAFHGQEYPTEEALQNDVRLARYAHTGPIYHPQTDLCVMAPDGAFVAGCEALIDAHNAEADIERVCTHSRFRQRGFARAVIVECFRRLRELGLRRAYITGYSPAAIGLYGSLSAAPGSESLIYTQTPPAASAE